MGVEPLNEACELAFAVARQGRESVPAIEAPASMRSFLWVAQLPPRAITVAQRHRLERRLAVDNTDDGCVLHDRQRSPTPRAGRETSDVPVTQATAVASSSIMSSGSKTARRILFTKPV